MNVTKREYFFLVFFKKVITDDMWIAIGSLPKLKTIKKKKQFWPDS